MGYPSLKETQELITWIKCLINGNLTKEYVMLLLVSIYHNEIIKPIL
jgi:hypothetical protein